MAGRRTRGTKGVGSGGVRHIPVLLYEVVEVLRPRDGGRYIDATFGAGGYARALLEAADCRVLAIDRDPEAIAAGASLQAKYTGRLKLVRGEFGDLAQIATDSDFAKADGIAMDIGVSSMQLDQPSRGFSFLSDGPLDMRMSQTGPCAADLLNSLEMEQIAQVLRYYGEERRARAIARRIVEQRAIAPLERTRELAKLVTGVLGPAKRGDKHPATRTFQALRIAVNGEFEQLAMALAAAERILVPGGRLAVVTFHSLEDRIVKRFLHARSGRAARGSRHLPEPAGEPKAPSFLFVNHRALKPGNEELGANPRARSATLRTGERTTAPPWDFDPGELGVPPIEMRV